MTTVVVISTSGNVGKTTLAKNMFAPLLGAKRVEVEDLNSGDGVADVTVPARKFRQLMVDLGIQPGNHVVDVGASNAKAMIDGFAAADVARELVNHWVIPVTPAVKTQKDAAHTVAALIEGGVPPDAITILGNNVESPETFDDDFAMARKLADKTGANFCEQGVLASELYELMKDKTDTIFSLVTKKDELRATKDAALAAGDQAKAKAAMGALMLASMGETVAKNLRSAIAAIPALAPAAEV